MCDSETCDKVKAVELLSAVMPLSEMERHHKCTTVKDEKSLRFIYGSEGKRLCEYALNRLRERMCVRCALLYTVYVRFVLVS